MVHVLCEAPACNPTLIAHVFGRQTPIMHFSLFVYLMGGLQLKLIVNYMLVALLLGSLIRCLYLLCNTHACNPTLILNVVCSISDS